MKRILAAALITGSLAACHPKIVRTTTENRQLDTVSVVANKPGADLDQFNLEAYNSSYPRRNDLIHTKLDVRFDWKKQYLLGKATLRLKPVFYQTDSLRLDAKGFDLHKVVLLKDGKEIALKYVYNDRKNIFIKLDKTYTNKDEYTVYIEYTAKPNELPIGGSDAITSDKGLYFINPLNEEPGKPQQIWTQGETESSSCWFPTIDRPNERCTQEIYITVEDRFKTLSNGILKSSNKNSDGTRTDYWTMDLPHAPYLFMMAIGEFAVVKDNWNGMLLEYYVEPAYEKDAKAIYPHTPEMLTFFSNRFGVKYPWQKYSQVIVRDYVSGAMENTTAVIFGEFCQKTTRELIDGSEMNEGIVAHEMMHHWFGDLVTCESWANLPLNESFAAYSEYLWFEYKHGLDAADFHRNTETDGYIADFKFNGNRHPLIYYYYADKEDMFDSHSYNKGAQILHMLRKLLGDAAYFEGLRVYLEENKYRAAEVHDLRLAFEKVTGEDLSWFFQQWFFTPGHPQLRYSKSYDSAKKELKINALQLQDPQESTTYILPLAVDVYVENGKAPVRYNLRITKAEQSFTIPCDKEPLLVNIDPERTLLCERDYEQTDAEYVFQYRNGKTYYDRSEALGALQYKQKTNTEARKVFEEALNDRFWELRRNAIDGIKIAVESDAAIIQKIETIAKTDKRANVRAAAFDKLGGLNDAKYLDAAKVAIEKDSSYAVLSSALTAISRVDQKFALQYAEKLEKENNATIVLLIADIYSKDTDRKRLSFFETGWKKVDGYARISFFRSFAIYLQTAKDDAFSLANLEKLKAWALDVSNSRWGRFGAASAIKEMRNYFFNEKGKEKLSQWCKDAINEIKTKESDSFLKRLYENKDWVKGQ